MIPRRVLTVLVTVAAGLAALAGPALADTGDTLLDNQTLAAGQTLLSGDGHFELSMQSDGNLVLYVRNDGALGRALWSSHTSGDKGDHAVLQDDGDMALVSSGGQVLWSTDTSGVGCANLVLQDDGNLVLYDHTKAVWASGTVDSKLVSRDKLTAGQRIFSPNEQYELQMSSDGDLVLDGPGANELWSSGTSGTGTFAELRSDGNFVVVDGAGHDAWLTHTDSDSGDHVSLQDDGNLVVYGSGGQAVWSSATNAHRATGASQFQPAAFQACPTATTTVPRPSPPSIAPSAPVVLSPTATRIPRLGRLHVRMTIDWTWDHATTRLHRITVTRLPRRATVAVSCRGRGCGPRAMHAGRSGLRRLLRRLDGHRYRAGDRIVIAIAKPGYRVERVGVEIRNGRLPRVRLL